MENFQNVVVYAWLLPSTLLTIHTLYTLVYVWMIPTGTKVPVIIGVGYLLFIYGPFEMKLYTKPKMSDAFTILFAGLVPVLSIVIIAFYIFQIFICIPVLIEQHYKQWKR
jgi:hypothetical protein